MEQVVERSEKKSKSRVKSFFASILIGILNDFKDGDNEFLELIQECLVVGALLFLSLIFKYAVILVVFVAALFITKHRNGKSFYLMFFLLPFLNIVRFNSSELYYSVYLWCILLIALGIKLLKDIITKRKKLNFFFTIMCGVLAIYFILPFGQFDFTCHGAVYLSLAILYVAYYYASEFKFKQIVYVFGLGIILASIFGLFRPLFSRAQEIIPEIGDIGIRFIGCSNDPNYYSGDLLLLLSGLMLLYCTKQINYSFYLAILPITIFCLMSLSKMALGIYAVIMVVFCLYLLLKNRTWKAVKNCMIMFLVVVVAAGVCFRQVNLLFKRLTRGDDGLKDSIEVVEPNKGNKDPGFIENVDDVQDGQTSSYVFKNNRLTVLTTGRTNIWISYLEKSTDSVIHVLFGHGIGAPFIYCDNGYKTAYFAEHNTFVQMIYRLGVIGVALVALTIISVCKKENFKKFKFYNIFTLLVVFGLFMSLCNLLSFRISLYLIFVAMSLVPVSENESMENSYKRDGELYEVNNNSSSV